MGNRLGIDRRYLPDEVREHDEMLDRIADSREVARDRLYAARKATAAARDADRQAKRQAMNDGDLPSSVKLKEPKAAEAEAAAQRDYQQVERHYRAEDDRFDRLLVKYADEIEAAALESIEATTLPAYQAAAQQVVDAGRDYREDVRVIAVVRGLKGDEAPRDGGAVSYGNGTAQVFDPATLATMLEADQRRHEPKPKRTAPGFDVDTSGGRSKRVYV